MDNELLQRVERVERENRLLKLAGLVLLVVVAGMGAVQKGVVSDTLVAHKIVITDEQGSNRAILSVDKDGAFLVFQNQGSTGLKLGLVGQEPHLDTMDNLEKSGWRNWLGKGRIVPAR